MSTLDFLLSDADARITTLAVAMGKENVEKERRGWNVKQIDHRAKTDTPSETHKSNIRTDRQTEKGKWQRPTIIKWEVKVPPGRLMNTNWSWQIEWKRIKQRWLSWIRRLNDYANTHWPMGYSKETTTKRPLCWCPLRWMEAFQVLSASPQFQLCKNKHKHSAYQVWNKSMH